MRVVSIEKFNNQQIIVITFNYCIRDCYTDITRLPCNNIVIISGCYKHKTNAQHTIWPELPVLLSFWSFINMLYTGGLYLLSIALSPCLPNFLSLSMLHYPLSFSFRPRK